MFSPTLRGKSEALGELRNSRLQHKQDGTGGWNPETPDSFLNSGIKSCDPSQGAEETHYGHLTLPTPAVPAGTITQ